MTNTNPLSPLTQAHNLHCLQVVQAVIAVLKPYQEQSDWEGALALVRKYDRVRVDKLSEYQIDYLSLMFCFFSIFHFYFLPFFL